MKYTKKALALFLALCMMLTSLPLTANATGATDTSDTLQTALAEAKTYIDALTINNSANDPAKVVKNFGTHFTWDNEKRENSKPYLYDWSYYNGVVFEGLEYVYEVTDEEAYKDYVVEYMSSLIEAGGTWSVCANNDSKQCAGYESTHGADCYKTASLLLDTYKMTGDSRYLTMAATLYADLDTAAKSYLLSSAGNNYRHTWASDPSPDLWLDGLYMILPFRAEYAKHIGDTEELDLIVNRMQWVSDNMYNESKGLFYHAADNASSNSGTYWLRSIGWYAAAIVDIMDSMEDDNLEAMKTQLVKLVNGMKAVQNTSNGMWLNNMAASQSSTNPYETSGTALVCYAVMKAVNEGWLDESYADMAILAFEGICNEKLEGTTLKDICYKGTPGSSNSEFKDNEGKGVGPFIMLYAEVMEYVNASDSENGSGDNSGETTDPETPVVPEEPTDQTVTVEDVEILVTNVTGLTGGTVTAEDKAVVDEKYTDYVAYDLTATLAEGEKATISIPVPAEWNATEDELKGISVEDGELRVIEGTLENGVYSFEVDHFSAKGVALVAENVEIGDDAWVTIQEPTAGKTTYEYTQATSITGAEEYVIVGNDHPVALMNNNGSIGSESVTISETTMTSTTELTEWTFSGSSSGTVHNGTRYLRYSNSNRSFSLSDQYYTNFTFTDYGSNFRIQSGNYSFYYNGSSWTRSSRNSARYVRLYQLIDTTTTDGQNGLYAAVAGPLSYDVAFGASKEEALAVVKAGITVYKDENMNSSTATIVDDAEATWTLADNYDGTTPGEYNVTISYKDKVLTTAKVIVPEKTIEDIALTDTIGTVYVGSTENASTGVLLKVIFDDKSEGTVKITVGMLSDSEGNAVNTEKTGTYSALDVTYEGHTVTGFTLNVIERPDLNYPEYPDEGSVDVNKVIADSSQFQNTGVAEVQLSTSGLPIKTGVNVILIMDISNSMSWDDAEYDYNDTAITPGTNQRLNISKDSAKEFVAELLTPYEDGSETENTLTLFAFAGIDGDYNTHSTAAANDDVYQLGATAMKSVDDANAAIDNMDKAITGGTNYDYAFQQAYGAAEELYALNGQAVHIVFMTDGVPTHYNGVYYKSRSNTDLTACMQYIDPATGEASSYTSTGNDRSGNDIDSTSTTNITVHYNDGTTAEKTVTYNKGWSDYVLNNKNGWAEKVKRLEYVAKVYSIGFGMKNGSVTQGATSAMPTLSGVNGGQYYIPASTTTQLLKNIASSESDYYVADNTEELTALYQSLASEIKQAATNAYFVDQMGDSFDLQMASTVTKFEGSDEKETIELTPTPKITVSTYNVYAASDVGKEIDSVTVTSAMVGQRYGTASVAETVTFNSTGTEAYSSVEANGIAVGQNIINEDGVICAKNFWYNTSSTAKDITLADGTIYSLPAETFYWNIGTISNKEFVLSYYVYLTGAAEGKAEAGTYATNNYATLYYKNWLDNDAKQSVDSPALAWESASVYYGFYLVDKEGQPVTNRATGATGSFYDAVKVTSKIFYDEVLLNDIEEVGTTIQVVSTMVPDGYNVYDTGATYTITIDSAAKVSGWEIVNTKTPDTTYVTDYNGTLATNITDSDKMDQTGVDYTATTVWFAVVWEPSTVPDVVVIDFGLPVDIGVLENDMFGSAGTLIGVGDIDAIPETVTSASTFAETQSADFKLSVKALDSDDDNLLYGHVSINSNEARYTPNSMQMCTTDKFAYEVRYENSTTNKNEYYYGDVTVIPATTIYYEDSFVTFTNGTTDGATLNSAGVGVWNTVGIENTTVTQEEDRPGEYSLPIIDANNVYGYDKAYVECSEYSLGSAKKVTVSAVNNPNTTYNPNKTAGTWPTATFTFTGSGFDIISLTSSDTGLIKVNVTGTTPDGTPKKHNWVVDTYYGYNYNTETGEWEVSAARGNDLYQIPVIKSGDKMVYGTYTVTITPMYSSNYDHTGAEEYDFYLDAIRVYDPANDGASDETIKNAYVADNEGWPAYTELRNLVITANDFYADTEKKDGIIFIDGIPALDASDTTINAVKDYTNYGPNNELYLAAGQAVAFELNAGTWKEVTENGVTTEILDSSNIASIQLAVKGVNGKATYKIYDAASNTADSANTKTVETATDLYYEDINSLNGKTVVIVNTATEDIAPILSITNIKVTFKTAPSKDLDLTSMVTVVPETESLAVFSLRRAVVDDSTTDDSTTEDNGTTDDGTTEDGGTTDGGTTEDNDTSYEEQITEVIETIVKAVKDVLNWLSGLSEQ